MRNRHQIEVASSCLFHPARSIVRVSSHGRLRFGTTSAGGFATVVKSFNVLHNRSRRNYNFKLLFLFASAARVQNGRLFAAVTRCVSAFFCQQMAPIARYLPGYNGGAEQQKSFIVISLAMPTKIFNVSTRISRFSAIFRLATTDTKRRCLFHKILQPEGDVFRIRHRLPATLPFA